MRVPRLPTMPEDGYAIALGVIAGRTARSTWLDVPEGEPQARKPDPLGVRPTTARIQHDAPTGPARRAPEAIAGGGRASQEDVDSQRATIRKRPARRACGEIRAGQE
jgi:hypothetical protein